MPLDPSHIGVISEPRTIAVEAGQLRFFAKAIGETDPVYLDEAAARAVGHRALPAPPTFGFSLALGAPAVRGSLFEDMGVDPHRVLHGEQRFRHHQPIYAGDIMTLVTVTKDIYLKKGGALEFIVQDTSLTNQAGDLCVEMSVVTAVRHG